MKLHLVVAMYNEAPCIAEGVRFIRDQSFLNFSCTLIDDTSSDETVAIVRREIEGDSRFSLIVNATRKHKTRNVVESIHAANLADEDVVVIVDGDDRLAHQDVLARVAQAYESPACWMTYGCYRDVTKRATELCGAYSFEDLRSGDFRKIKWLASHLKTFRYGLFRRLGDDVFSVTDEECRKALRRSLMRGHLRAYYKYRQVKREDLLDDSGSYCRRCDDKAMTFAMLEMAREHAVYIDEVLYLYDYKKSLPGVAASLCPPSDSAKWEGRLIRDILAHKSRYSPLDRL